MNEKIYKTMSSSGCWNLAIGITVMVVGVAAGVMLVINGAKLLKQKYQIML